MKNLFLLPLGLLCSVFLLAQSSQRPDVFEKANNAANKVTNIVAVFQPYLLKARQLFYDAKQLAGDVKNASKKGAINNTGVTGGMYSNNTTSSGYGDPSNTNNQNSYSSGNYSQNQGSSNSSGYGNTSSSTNNTNYSSASSGGYGNNNSGYNNSTSNGGYSGNNIQSYLPNQSLPVNNDASVNNDGTGNWGNQNNGLYGNCLDALTGTVLGMGEAAQSPTSVDLMFFAPADGQNTYYIMTPGFAKNNSTATYMTEHTSDQVQQWSDVNETEVALTKITIGQFEQIQNNNQILSAVRNAQNYSGYYSSVGQKLDGHVFAVKAQMENREVYALVAILKQNGTSGNNGYLKIKIKAQGVGSNGQINANAYVR